MDWWVLPFSYNQDKQSIDTFRERIIEKLDENQKQTQTTILQSQRDHHTGELDNLDQVDVTVQFEHDIHGVKKYKFLSNTVLQLIFHSERQEPLSGLHPQIKKYREHRNRVITPPKFDKSFIIIFNTDTAGLLLAPNGTPTRVDYIVRELSSLLELKVNKKIRFTPEKMDLILSKLGKDGDKIKSIDWISATVADKDSYERHNTTYTNIGSINRFNEYRSKHASFKLDQIRFTAKYSHNGVDKIVSITLRSKPNEAPLSIGFNHRDFESKKDVFQWLGSLIL